MEVASFEPTGTMVTAVVPRTEDVVPAHVITSLPEVVGDVRVRTAWGVVALTTIAVLLDTVFTAAYRPLLSEATWADHGWPLAPLAGLGCALMGALIVSRHPRHLWDGFSRLPACSR